VTDLELSILRLFRTFGAMSNADVGRKLGIKPDATYPVVCALTELGLLEHHRKQLWDITEAGEQWFLDHGSTSGPQLYQENAT
jgi:Mn-dependent DtxR family transcriptional regulator